MVILIYLFSFSCTVHIGALRPLRSHLVTPQTKLKFAAAMATESLPKYETLLLSRPKDYVIQVELNRPDKRNAMNKSFWRYG